MTKDEFYIKKCIELAKKAEGYVSPNPLVGSVIVKDDEIVSEDYHKAYGTYHAERNAILKLGNYDFSDCDIYCNLEPCTHFGKTPPCSDLIIEKKFKRVIFGSFDPNPLVAGKSLEKFRTAGITTAFKVLEKDCRYLNRFFFKHIKSGLPWVIAKWAESEDGFISSGKGTQEQLTGVESQKDVHLWRSKIDAILIGTNTAIIDNPQLSVRLVNGRNPKKIIIDKELKISLKSKLFKEAHNTYLICSQNVDQIRKDQIKYIGANIIEIDSNDNFDLNIVLQKIGSLGVNSLIVEGGGILLNHFFDQDLIDEIHKYKSKVNLSSGIKVKYPVDNFKLNEEFELSDDSKQIFIKA